MAATNLFRSALLCLFLVSYIGILPVNQLQDLPLQDQIEYPYQITQVLSTLAVQPVSIEQAVQFALGENMALFPSAFPDTILRLK